MADQPAQTWYHVWSKIAGRWQVENRLKNIDSAEDYANGAMRRHYSIATATHIQITDKYSSNRPEHLVDDVIPQSLDFLNDGGIDEDDIFIDEDDDDGDW